MINSLLIDNNIYNLYQFGSMVYKTNHEGSDKDYIAICENIPHYGSLYQEGNTTIHFLTKQNFQNLLDLNEIQAIECVFLSNEFILKEQIKYEFVLNKENLRRTISTIASNSFQKCKKKLIIQGDYDKYNGIKSLFHSIRILDLGIQLGSEGRIYDYSKMNWLFQDLMKISSQMESVELWNYVDNKYRELFNKLTTQFKKLCPIDKHKGLLVNISENKVIIDNNITIDFNSDIMNQLTKLLDIIGHNYQKVL